MSQPDYGLLSRLLHRAALGSRFVGQASFDMEEMTLRGKPTPEITNPVFIAGLARSGSTVLLNALYQSGAFRSLTYRDMPFILMSGLWQRLSSSSQVQREARERAHGDRLLVEYDSPEAFEEIFWRVFHGDKYIFVDKVIPHHATASVRKNFHRFVGHVLNSAQHEEQRTYLSKNNNNLLRLPTLKKIFPDAKIVIPFRHPLQQASSLLRQHQMFSERQATDHFSLDYMNWLGHYEFGLGHKHYVYSDREDSVETMDINYWLQNWLDAYNFALATAPEDAIFFGYEEVCKVPLESFSALFRHLQLECDANLAANFYEQATAHQQSSDTGELMVACQRTYLELSGRHSSL